MAFFEAASDTFQWSPELHSPLPFPGSLLAARYVDDLNTGLNSLFAVFRLSTTSIALVHIDADEDVIDVEDCEFTHTLPATWYDEALVVELLDGPRVWLSCPARSESQLLGLHEDSLQVLQATIPQPNNFISAQIVSTDVVDPTAPPHATHILVHEMEEQSNRWRTFPLSHPSSARKQPKSSPMEPPKQYLPVHMDVACVHIFQDDERHPSRFLVGTTAPSLAEIVHNCLVASIQLPGPPVEIIYARLESDVFAVRCNDANRTVCIVVSANHTLSIVQEFTNVDRVYVNDFKMNGQDQFVLVHDENVDQWILTDVNSVHPASKARKTKKRNKKSSTGIQIQMDKISAPDQAEKLKSIQASLTLRASQAQNELAQQKAMLEHQKMLIEMMKTSCWQEWLALHKEYTALEDQESVSFAMPPLQTLIPSPDAVADSTVALKKPLLVHPMELLSVEPVALQHSLLSSVVHVRATIRNLSSASLNNVTLLIVGSTTELRSRCGVVSCLESKASHEFFFQIIMASNLRSQTHLKWHIIAKWGVESALLFENGSYSFPMDEILRLPVTVPDQVSCNLLLMSKECQLTEWLPVHQQELAINDIETIQPGAAQVKISAPNQSMLELKMSHLQRCVKPHNIFALENPLKDSHRSLIRQALASMKAEATNPTSLKAQGETDQAIGLLLKAMKRRDEYHAL
ncbi:hypothetical protein Ae201684P_010017 [Aphanomyces euteiches]|uniref:Uncharacterized protein n=1 Tax=Aphanomyces euteiches TaxID=100861 RepID=A0A6G0X095_9STRA|nr:hypothetical protein Ae201684_010006 [Aphanomyces euteiches]KAH9095804.1 hypothetical protein Ae201684P_010017 [Aphanomyces euteiches]